MEYNKDESAKSLNIARECLSRGDKERALKFACKSERLYPSAEAKSFVEKIHKLCDAKFYTTNGFHYKEKMSNADVSPEQGESLKYTKEQVEAVNRIKGCKDYYEILGIDKNADNSEIKKRYRKLALQFHPDKNHAPGAVEAFKAIGNAFSILSDSCKRRKYDLAQSTDSQHYCKQQQNQWNYSHGFESDMTADEIFNMFFGPNFTTVRTANRSTDATAHTFRRHHHVTAENFPQLLLQVLPIVILIVISLASMVFVDEKPYSLFQSSKFSRRLETKNFRIAYFVTADFSQKHSLASMKRIERDIERPRYNLLLQECRKERARKDRLKWKAKVEYDGKGYEKAEQMVMRSCKTLEKIDIS